ncbi:ORF108 [Saltwater crocodilepox virus]|nr:hypothetical protein [Saltwater crocodilepox virus]QGT46547.1 ORF108 [Saltwater crocodilepox virus]QGT46763.1 ORF108 [Saltwater crocodilepox virus]QGT46979.1 ORF108 [Saltwater crocodilepox virus]QGT47192.1 ORF108 [Saltwater crocodilepox virus]
MSKTLLVTWGRTWQYSDVILAARSETRRRASERRRMDAYITLYFIFVSVPKSGRRDGT